MDSSDETMRLLTEIRDIQREHLTEYRRVTQRSLEMHEQAMQMQERAMQVQDRAMQVQASSVAKQKLGLLAVLGVLVLFGVYLVLLSQR